MPQIGPEPLAPRAPEATPAMTGAARTEAPGKIPEEPSGETILMGSPDGRFSNALLGLVLDAIGGSQAFKDRARAAIADSGATFSSYPELLHALNQLARGWIREDSESLGFDPFEIVEALAVYKARIAENLDAYDVSKKPNPDAVFWPNPERTPPRSVFETQPYTEKVPLVTKSTAIGSAGSCFAIEIARNLQRRGFNYVVTESEAEDAANGVLVDGIQQGNPHDQSSANHGLLFNTPSFRQLVEKAFEVRRPKRILLPTCLPTQAGNLARIFMDPFREDVVFLTREAFEANYEKHLAAVREAFLKSEVFVVTPGLNECWEFVPDGSVLSRNPRELDMYPFVRHRVLTVEENVANLQRMFDVIRAHNPSLKLIVSLSPVPFLATGRGGACHVITANCHSKAVLRVAIEEFVKANRDVYYFPSYEFVTTCIESPWGPDERHVTAEAVGRVMELFDKMFVH